ncbi:acetylcholine receptor subunit alpha-L1 isoform X1 [Anabrus simplex]|uniref:acetylcholine receptor subunit alpha-L1 isoform X1 n=1 Tax=Anabrus simplex TaxID=316456 RepID=UPI0035A37DDA
MVTVFHGLCWFLLTLGFGMSDQDCRTPLTASRLRKDIFCGYDRTVRPAKDFNSVMTIEIHTEIKFLLFNEYTDQLFVTSWMIWAWNDQFLTWSPENYGGIKTLMVSASSIWIPDLSFEHMGMEQLGPEMLADSKCMLESSGKVRCMPSSTFPVQCEARTTHWPFMRAECHWFLHSWLDHGYQVNLSILGEGLDLRHYEPDMEWELLAANVNLYEETYRNSSLPYLLFWVEIARHSAAHEATVLIPTVVASVLTLLVFCLPAVSSERLALGCLSLLVHCVNLQHLAVEMPLSKDENPTILNFYRVSLLMIVGTLGLSVLYKWMYTTTRPPPQWFTRPADCVLRKWRLRRQLRRLLPEDDEVGEEATESAEKTAADKLKAAQAEFHDAWRLLVTILDITCFVIVLSVLGLLLNSVFNEKYRV